MMKNKSWILLIGVSLILLAASFVLYKKAFEGYAILTFTIFVILFLAGIISYVRYGNSDSAYNSDVKSILNTYDSVMVRSSNIPDLENRGIVVLMSFDDLIDAQLEVRKPICYLKQTDSCSFILLDENEAYIYVMKSNENVVSPVEDAIKELENKKKCSESIDYEILNDIEKTTVIKLPNQRSYKVSPIRKEKKEDGKKKETVHKNKRKGADHDTSSNAIDVVEKQDKVDADTEKSGQDRFVLHSFDN